jgi:hypothetical protein
LELIEDYDLGINYHPGKDDVVADTLSRRSHVTQLVVDSMPFKLCEEFDKFNLRIIANTEAMEIEVGSSLLQEIQRDQLEDEKVQEIKRNIKEEKSSGFSEGDEGVLWYKGRICVPIVKELKDKILREAHDSVYSMISRPLIGGTVLTETLLSMLPFARLVSKSNPSINDLLDYCSRCKFPSGSGKRLSCILSWGCQELNLAMIPFGWSWID